MMQNDITTACPLDCYDACGVAYQDDKLKALKACHTQGFLCPNLNHYLQNETIADAMMDRLIHSSHKIEIRGDSMRKLHSI